MCVQMFAGAAGNDGSKAFENPVLVIGKMVSTPVLDGNIDDDCWKTAAVMEGFTLIGGSYPVDQTVAKMAYDDKYLYVAIK